MEQLNLLKQNKLNFSKFLFEHKEYIKHLHSWYTKKVDKDFNAFMNKPFMFNLGILLLFLEEHNLVVSATNWFYYVSIIDPKKVNYDLGVELIAKDSTCVIDELYTKEKSITVIYTKAVLAAIIYLETSTEEGNEIY